MSILRRLTLHSLPALLALALAGCSVGVTDVAPTPLVGGSYRYTATLIDGQGALLRGTLVLRDGPGGGVGGSYRLPQQCRTGAGESVDCAGTIRGTVETGATITLDFDSEAMHHEGVVQRDGRLEGMWHMRAGESGRTITGRFTALPLR